MKKYVSVGPWKWCSYSKGHVSVWFRKLIIWQYDDIILWGRKTENSLSHPHPLTHPLTHTHTHTDTHTHTQSFSLSHTHTHTQTHTHSHTHTHTHTHTHIHTQTYKRTHTHTHTHTHTTPQTISTVLAMFRLWTISSKELMIFRHPPRTCKNIYIKRKEVSIIRFSRDIRERQDSFF